ncbi:hypothetical protein D3C75_1129740 [compost metagenome]
MDLFCRQATDQRRLIIHVASGAALPGAQQHAQAPGPTVGHAQPALRRYDQRQRYQAVIQQQANGRQLQVEVLAYPLAHHHAQASFIARALGLEDVGKGGLFQVGVVQQ